MPMDISVNNILGVVHPEHCGWTLARVRLCLFLRERNRQRDSLCRTYRHRAMLTNEMANTTPRLLMPITLMRFSDNNSGRISRRAGETCTATEHASERAQVRSVQFSRSFVCSPNRTSIRSNITSGLRQAGRGKPAPDATTEWFRRYARESRYGYRRSIGYLFVRLLWSIVYSSANSSTRQTELVRCAAAEFAFVNVVDTLVVF